MPEIKVKITQRSVDFSTTSTELQSNSLTGLLSALAKAKTETNSNLTKIVESQNITTSRKTKAAEGDEDSNSEDDDESSNKKQKT